MRGTYFHCICCISSAGLERIYNKYQVLVQPEPGYFEWVRESRGCVPINAVLGGEQSDGQKYFIGRAYIGGYHIIGRIDRVNQCLFAPISGTEVKLIEYEVLVLKIK